MTVRLASCSCGQLQTEVRGDPIRVSVCHCYACQRRTGSVFSAQAGFPRESVAIKGNGTEFVRVGDEGGRFRSTFCPECGSTVFYVEEGDEQEIAIPVGAFADSHFPAPTVSVYEERRHSW
ncbi:MAG: GFA family protein, partial [Actinomycetota bacterium]|nr:GFA family protein [Actinomycetota bacterium]